MTKFDFASERASADLQPGNPSRRRLFPGNVRRRRETNRVERGENAPPNGRQPPRAAAAVAVASSPKTITSFRHRPIQSIKG